MVNCDIDFEKVFINDKPLRKRDHIDYMTLRLFTMFEYKGLPDTIPAFILERILQWNGNACIFKHEGELYATFGGLGGEPDYNYEPTLYVIANPSLNYSAELRIGEDCVRFRNDAFGKGLLPMHARYADLIVENDITLRIADIIRRMDHGITADNDRAYESANEFIDRIEKGKLVPIMSEEFFEGIKAIETSRMPITDLIEFQQYLKASWFNELGLNANYNMKRERIAAPEAQMNDSALRPLVDHLLEMRKLGCEMVNEMFGTEWDVDFSGAWKAEQERQRISMEGMKEDEEEENTEDDGGEGGDPGYDEGGDNAGGSSDPSDADDSVPDEGDDPMEDRIDLNITVINTTGDDNLIDVLEEESEDTEDPSTEEEEEGGEDDEEETD